MKNMYYMAAAVVLCASTLGACKKEMPLTYDDTHGVYVDAGLYDAELADERVPVKNLDSLSATFLTTTDETITVWVKVMTKGRVNFDNDRHFDAVVVDSLPIDKGFVMAVEAEYELGEMVVQAGKEYGLLPITLKRSDRIMNENVSVQVMVKLVPSPDFPYVGTYVMNSGKLEEYIYFKVKWSNVLQEPPSWIAGRWNTFFGVWDRVKFAFILNTLKETAPDWEKQAPSIGAPFDWTNYNMATTYKNIMTNALVYYKINNAADPETYPPLYWPTDSETWITFSN